MTWHRDLSDFEGGEGLIPLRRSPRWMGWLAVGLAALFLWAVAFDAQRIASGEICEVLLRDDMSEKNRELFAAALAEMPVTCTEPESWPATPVGDETPGRPRTRSSASRRGP